MLDRCSIKLLELTINWCTWDELLKRTGAPPSSIYWHLRRLIRCGMVEARGRRRLRYRATLKGVLLCINLGCGGSVERAAQELGISLIEADAVGKAFFRIVQREGIDLTELNVTRENVISTIVASILAAPGRCIDEKIINTLGDSTLIQPIRDLLNREIELLKGKREGDE
jgi:DNA-binding transcriptional ArsR family regulator